MEMIKKLTKNKFIYSIKDSKSIAIAGFRWSGTPQLLLKLIRRSFDDDSKPNNITIIFTSSATDPGLDHLAHPKLISCSIGSYYGSIPKIRSLVQRNLIKAYSLPQGQISLLFREIARGSPGLISKVGMNTYIDPRLGGGKLNNLTKDNLVKHISLENESFLLFKSFKIDTVLIRGSVADDKGNISMKNEPVRTEFLSMAQAAKSSNGKVFVQVAEQVKGILQPFEIDLPSHLIDGYLIVDSIEKEHRHTNKYHFNDKFITNSDSLVDQNKTNDPIYKSIIAEKTISLVKDNSKVILGQGVPELVGVLARKKVKKFKNLTTFMESGVIGGIPERRPDFGVSFNPNAFLAQDNQFVGFNGGHMDMAILSFVEFDQYGNVNVSILGDRYFGCGGYIDICYAVSTIIFVGSFTAKGLKVEKRKKNICILKEGEIKKGVNKVKEVTFSPVENNKKEKKIYIITERCIFAIENETVILKEVYPGIDFEKDIFDEMEFKPLIDKNLIINN